MQTKNFFAGTLPGNSLATPVSKFQHNEDHREELVQAAGYLESSTLYSSTPMAGFLLGELMLRSHKLYFGCLRS